MDRQHVKDAISESDADSFDDAPETTPQARPRASSSRARSLTKRPSSSGVSHRSISVMSVEPIPDDKEAADGIGHDAGKAHSQTADSPPLTSKRTSMPAMDEVNLYEDQQSKSHESDSPLASPVHNHTDRLSLSSSTQQQHESGASEPNSPTKKMAQKLPNLQAPTPVSRKLTSPFAWLSRNTSGDKKPTPPSVPRGKDKREHSSSVTTLDGNAELMLNRMDGSKDAGGSGHVSGSRDSLRDRFKLLRMREEAGITSLETEPTGSKENQSGGALAGLIGRSASLGLGVGSPTSFSGDDKGDGSPSNSRRGTVSTSNPPLVRRSTVDIHLAPGTAAGVVEGPADDAAPPVDWDLWQSVVYEGPQAVVKKSPEELNQAIVSGIPQVIRGVVWQVLAQSKNSELEDVYRELISRGTEKSRPASIDRTSESSGHQANGVSKERESITSSSSSIHSDHSTPATTTASINQPGSPRRSAHGHSSELLAKFRSTTLDKKANPDKDKQAAVHKLEKAIKRDLGARTSYSKYMMAAGLQDGLFGICKAYALFDEAVGYAQGINFIAMPLLFNMSEAEAFCLLVRLMEQYGLRDLFIHDMPGLHMHLYQFERLLEDFEPALYYHLSRRNVNPQLYATQWFLTLFAYRFPLQLVLRIYDLILSEGLEGAILKFGIVLMQKNAHTLLEMQDMSALTTFLKERLFDIYIDKSPSANSILESGFFGSTSGNDKEVYRADILVRDACSIKIRPETLRKYADEWREKQRAEKEREAEIESLRQQCATLTSKVRVLEERAEKSDQEHVVVASELVRTKVDNEALKDTNESLSGQVDELKKIVAGQTEEVEQRLKGEMDTVMQRNIEVHNANRALEDQLSEMERDFVETKMQYAQINSEHEALKQRWNSVSAMLANK